MQKNYKRIFFFFTIVSVYFLGLQILILIMRSKLDINDNNMDFNYLGKIDLKISDNSSSDLLPIILNHNYYFISKDFKIVKKHGSTTILLHKDIYVYISEPNLLAAELPLRYRKKIFVESVIDFVKAPKPHLINSLTPSKAIDNSLKYKYKQMILGNTFEDKINIFFFNYGKRFGFIRQGLAKKNQMVVYFVTEDNKKLISFLIGYENNKELTLSDVSKVLSKIKHSPKINKKKIILNINSLSYSKPQIVKHPMNKSVSEGDSVNFSVSYLGTNVQFQWYKKGKKIFGATDSYLYIEAVSKKDNKAIYYCILKNESGVARSNDAILSIKK